MDFENSEYEWLWPILVKDWKNSWFGPVAMQNIILSYQFDKMLSSLPKQELGFYLMENQNWERLFLFFWRKYGHGKIIGVAHTTIRYWDLRYFDTTSKQVLPNLPQPDLVAVNGKNAWDTLNQTGYQMNRCVPVEALRYQYLRKFYPVNRQEISKDKKKLLVLGDISNLTTHQMMLQLESVYHKFKDKFTVKIKPHTANNIDITKYPRISASLEKQNLMDIFLKSDVVLASIYTSASLDAFCAGLPVMIFLDPNNFNFSPLRLNPNIRFINNAEEIILSLQDEQWLTQEIFVKPSDFFWLDEEMPRWNKLIRRAIY